MSSRDVEDAPSGEFQENSYVSRQGEKAEPIPVQADSDKIEDPIDPNMADTDVQLGMKLVLPPNDANPLTAVTTERDDAEAIDKTNIVKERTRGAGKPGGTYREPGDEEGLPDDTGRSSN
ncbi:hypothetical protein ACJZ2D_012417 [Fusarium nematophilum]